MPEQYEPTCYVHGQRLAKKVRRDRRLQPVFDFYERWRDNSTSIIDRRDDDIRRLTELLNQYKDYAEPIFDKRKNSAQEGLQPSILEEFFEFLFCQLGRELDANVLREPASGFIGLSFNPMNLSSLMSAPEYTIRKKDHDFVIGARVNLVISSAGAQEERRDQIVVPAVAIECKRYLERNMLDECAGTAEKIKRATPYCKYFVVAEFLKLDEASPEDSVIDEIYIIRKQKNLERNRKGFQADPICWELVRDIYRECVSHLTRLWWDPSSALTTGKVFSRP